MLWLDSSNSFSVLFIKLNPFYVISLSEFVIDRNEFCWWYIRCKQVKWCML